MIELNGVTRYYGDGPARVVALDHVSLTIETGAFVAIMGASGSGKSTLLNVMGGVDRVSEGKVVFDGERFDTLSEEDLTSFRRGFLAYVFQQYHLVPSLTVLENVMLPLVFRGIGSDETRALQMLKRVGLKYRASHRPSELSGGEQQRAAIARALVNDPSLILADEPTGNLDRKSGRDVMRLMTELNEEGRTIVMVTHNPEIARCAREIVELSDGRIVARSPVGERETFTDERAVDFYSDASMEESVVSMRRWL